MDRPGDKLDIDGSDEQLEATQPSMCAAGSGRDKLSTTFKTKVLDSVKGFVQVR